MRLFGNDIYVQSGERFSLDFEVTNEKGDPYMLFNKWENPYLAITIASARYEQPGDFRRTYWLDLVNFKRFISTEALPVTAFSIADVISAYPNIKDEAANDFDVTNYLFSVSDNGKKTYKHVERDGTAEVWTEYAFRIVKHFTTRDMIEQSYLLDMKVLAGESIKEHIAELAGLDRATANEWSDGATRAAIESIEDVTVKAVMQELFDDGAPLMPMFDIESVVLKRVNLYVSSNIQGGVK